MFVLYLVKTNNGFMAYSIRPTYISTLCLRKKYFLWYLCQMSSDFSNFGQKHTLRNL